MHASKILSSLYYYWTTNWISSLNSMTTLLTRNQYTSIPYFYNNSASIIIKSTHYSRHHHHYGSCTPDSPMLSFCFGEKISLSVHTINHQYQRRIWGRISTSIIWASWSSSSIIRTKTSRWFRVNGWGSSYKVVCKKYVSGRLLRDINTKVSAYDRSVRGSLKRQTEPC